LYVGSALNLLFPNESNLKLGARLGVVGPAAKGEEVQHAIHKTLGFYEIIGWQYQIKNDVELNTSAEYNRLIIRVSQVDATINSYANIGTGFTGVGAGATFRIGRVNELFNSISTQSTATRRSVAHNKESFFYYQPRVNVIAYDATIQGSLFRKNNFDTSQITLDPRRVNFTQQVGFAYSVNRSIINLSVLFSTKDVKQMRRVHQWGSISLFYRFN
jgi:lipid A 3-O-deacylase